MEESLKKQRLKVGDKVVYIGRNVRFHGKVYTVLSIVPSIGYILSSGFIAKEENLTTPSKLSKVLE